MRFMVVSFIGFLTLPAFAVNRIAAFHHGEEGTLVMAMSNQGLLHNFDRNEWTVLGEPCPGEAPFSLHLMNGYSIDNSALIYVIDSAGTCYQTDGTRWEVFLHSPDSTVDFSTGTIFSTSDTHFAVVLVDENGETYVNSPGGTCRKPFPVFPAAPVRDMAVYYDRPTDLLNLFVIGSDGKMYGCIRGQWQSADSPDYQWDIRRIEMNVNPETGDGFIVASDGEGCLYSNVSMQGLRPAEFDAFPEPGPWDLELIHSGGDGFDLLCIDSTGRLYLAMDGSWNSVCEPFPLYSP